jgi:putative transposase
MSAPAARREAVGVAMERRGISERYACQLVGMSRSGYRPPVRPDRNAWLRMWLKELAETRMRFGAPRLYLLLRREGHVVNHKRVTRLYREEGLSLRRKRRRKRISHLRVVWPAPTRVNQQWSMDFVMDSLWNGRRFRALTIVDDFSWESPAIEVGQALSGLRVARVLDRLAKERGLPEVITVDNGPEFQSRALNHWAY